MKQRKKIHPTTKWRAAIAARRSQSPGHDNSANESDQQASSSSQEKK